MIYCAGMWDFITFFSCCESSFTSVKDKPYHEYSVSNCCPDVISKASKLVSKVSYASEASANEVNVSVLNPYQVKDKPSVQ